MQGRRLLPGVAYLEMARAAVARASGQEDGSAGGVHLKHVVWARPFAVGAGGSEISIELAAEESGSYQMPSLILAATGRGEERRGAQSLGARSGAGAQKRHERRAGGEVGNGTAVLR